MNIVSALAQGFTITQVLDWLKKNDRTLGKKIKDALRQGHTEDEIGQYLTKGASMSYSNRQNLLSGMSEREKGERISNYQPPIETALRKALPSAAIGLAGAAAAPALIRSLPMAAQQMLGLGGAGSAAQPGAAAAIPTSIQPAAQSSVPGISTGAQAGVQVAQAAAIAGQGAKILGQMGDKVTGIIKSLAGQQTPEIIAAVLDQKILSPGQKKWLSEQGATDLVGLVKDYLTTSAPQEAVQAQKVEQPAQQPVAEIPQAPAQGAPSITAAPAVKPKEQAPQEPKKVEVGAEAMLPSGDIGKLHSIKNGIAKITIDGKERHVKVDELEVSPLPVKELADLLEDLHRGIEKETGQELSRMAGFVGYDPNANEIEFRGYTGSSYTFADIDPEDAEFLKNAVTFRKTSNENYIGPWEKGTKSVIGNKLHELITKYRKRAEEANKPSTGELSESGVPIETSKGKAHSRKFEPIYEAYGPAHEALKKKKSEEKKKAKDEERKAKGKAPRKKKKPVE